MTDFFFFFLAVLFNTANEMLILSHSLLSVAKQTINYDVRASPGMQTAVKDDTEEEKKTSKRYSSTVLCGWKPFTAVTAVRQVLSFFL